MGTKLIILYNSVKELFFINSCLRCVIKVGVSFDN